MILKDHLFTITSKDEAAAAYEVRINPAWPIYQAHFPGHPITPGVCIVQMVQELLSDLQGRPLMLSQAKTVKYVQLISPEEVTQLTVSFAKIEEQPDGAVKVQAQVSSGDTLYTKISATFA